jgi:hypothetical protein
MQRTTLASDKRGPAGGGGEHSRCVAGGGIGCLGTSRPACHRPRPPPAGSASCALYTPTPGSPLRTTPHVTNELSWDNSQRPDRTRWGTQQGVGGNDDFSRSKEHRTAAEGTQHLYVRLPSREGVNWPGGRAHTPSREPHWWGTSSTERSLHSLALGCVCAAVSRANEAPEFRVHVGHTTHHVRDVDRQSWMGGGSRSRVCTCAGSFARRRLSRAHKSTNGTLRVVKVWQF